MEENTFIFSGNAILIYKMQTEQRNWVYVKNNFLHSTNKSILVCKLVTVNCLSRYSGCKCILTFTNKSIIISHKLILTSCDLTREVRDRHITHGTLMIS